MTIIAIARARLTPRGAEVLSAITAADAGSTTVLRAAVACVLLSALRNGPRPVAFARIRRETRALVGSGSRDRRLDAELDALVADGWFEVRAEAVPGVSCRVWGLGERSRAVVRSSAVVPSRTRVGGTSAAVGGGA